jgi:hypothetical protein
MPRESANHSRADVVLKAATSEMGHKQTSIVVAATTRAMLKAACSSLSLTI